ncbi:5671_t:CDS:2, partial [Funneliformis mosseae]
MKFGFSSSIKGREGGREIAEGIGEGTKKDVGIGEGKGEGGVEEIEEVGKEE